MEFTRRHLLLVLTVAAVVVMFVAAFFAGRLSAPSPETNNDYAMATAFLQKDEGAPSFCELSERARMYVCPALRRVISMPDSGHAVIYKCRHDGSKGYIEMTDMTEETKIMLRSRAAQSGVHLRKICGEKNSEVYRVIGGGAQDVRYPI